MLGVQKTFNTFFGRQHMPLRFGKIQDSPSASQVQARIQEFLEHGGQIQVLPPEIPLASQKVGRCRSGGYWMFRSEDWSRV